MFATSHGHTEIVQALLTAGADVHAKQKDDWTVLMQAAYKGHTKTLQALLSGGADVHAKNKNAYRTYPCSR